ncbi:hypothetical protein BDZ91DRAFT_710506 [Kalaharituber pfeilii]|nr:hypothetical protein BDZ91DRAFT_710506 [Kalaharituber pfeilii]
MAAEPLSFGSELKDAFKPVNSWVSHGIVWLDEIQSFYRERSLIEKEYSSKLNQLARKYFDKKAKRSATLSVGESPHMTPGSLESASLVTWTSILNSTEILSKEHETLSVELLNQVADPLKDLAARYEDYRKRHEGLATKLQQERDLVYAELKKTKEKYDHQCKEVEAARVKVEKSFDSSKFKAEKAKQQELLDMNNVKNTYLVAINVTNRHKEKYFHEDVPDLLNSLQDLNECRVAKLNAIWNRSASLESECHKRCNENLLSVMSEIKRNLPYLDSNMFVEHNIATWNEPAKFEFEPSMVWHDTDDIVVDEPAQVFLRNLMTKSRRSLDEIKPDVEKKQREVESLKAKKEQVKLDESTGQVDAEVTRALFNSLEEFIVLDNKKTTFQMEIDTILLAVGDIARGASTHKFKSASFKIPTNCDFCQERIWSMGSKGYTCRDCGYSCHAKCEMKVPATCPGVLDKAAKKAFKEEKRASIAVNSQPAELGNGDENASGISRSNTMTSTLSSSHSSGGGGLKSMRSVGSKLSKSNSIAMPARNRVIAPPPEKYAAAPPPPPETIAEMPTDDNLVKGRMLYTYNATGEGEITVEEGKEILIVEPDDNSGWMKVKCGLKSGLVPASYVETNPAPSERPMSAYSSSTVSIAPSITNSTIGKKKGPAVAPKRGAKKVKYVEAMYAYEAQTSAEFSMQEGDKFVLVKQDSGDGWAEVELNGVIKSVPANYIQILD